MPAQLVVQGVDEHAVRHRLLQLAGVASQDPGTDDLGPAADLAQQRGLPDSRVAPDVDEPGRLDLLGFFHAAGLRPSQRLSLLKRI